MSELNPDSPRPIAVVGAGSYGIVIAELAESCGYRVTDFLDDDPAKNGSQSNGVPVSGPIKHKLPTLPQDTAIAVAIGDNAARLHWLRQAQLMGRSTPPLVSTQALVSPSAQISSAVYLHPGCHVWTQVEVRHGSILSPHATVAHHTVLGEGCFVSSGANIGASIAVAEGAFFGMGSVTSTGVSRIAEYSTIGAGTVIIRDTQPYGVYVGSPGRLIKHVPANS